MLPGNDHSLGCIPSSHQAVDGWYDHKNMADAVRVLSMDMVQKAHSGHPGAPMGMADVLTVLWTRHLRHIPGDPMWPARDRFVLSAGHACAGLYAVLHLLGYAAFDQAALQAFRQLDSTVTHGHPERCAQAGIDATTGPLGQGFAMAVGMALSQVLGCQKWPFIQHHTYVVVGDGCLMEGISYEAAALAGHWRLRHLIALWDDNQITIDGAVHLSSSEDVPARFRACGWSVLSVDGHDPVQVDAALTQAKTHDRPTLIACRTRIGYGARQAGTAAVHGSPLGAEGVAWVRANLHWPCAEPFAVPEPVYHAWQQAGQRWISLYDQWQASARAHPLWSLFQRQYLDSASTIAAACVPQTSGQTEPFLQAQDIDCQGENWTYESWRAVGWKPGVITDLLTHYQHRRPCQATRKSSGQSLHAVANGGVPLVAGSADLGESTQVLPGPGWQLFAGTEVALGAGVVPEVKACVQDISLHVHGSASGITAAKEKKGGVKVLGETDCQQISQAGEEGYQQPLSPHAFYVHYGVREHAMAGVMNGLAVHGLFRPCGSTFLAFSDYARPSMRLSALMGVPVVYVMTHDSIGLGEDGPTHQPIEQIASLRAMPGMNLMRPADCLETAACWQVAVALRHTPTVLALSRQNVPCVVPADWSPEEVVHQVSRGAYILAYFDGLADTNSHQFNRASDQGALCLGHKGKRPAAQSAIKPMEGQDHDGLSSLLSGSQTPGHYDGIDIWATGSEVSLALEVGRAVASLTGVGVRIISAPSLWLLAQQPVVYQRSLARARALQVVIEAASPWGWERFVGSQAVIVGMSGFGACGPGEQVMHHFGFETQGIVHKVLSAYVGSA